MNSCQICCLNQIWIWICSGRFGSAGFSGNFSLLFPVSCCIEGHMLWVDMVSILTFGCSGRSGLTMWRTKRSDFELGLYCLACIFWLTHLNLTGNYSCYLVYNTLTSLQTPEQT